MTLDEYLNKNDLTETAFARLVGCSQGTINKLRNRKANPTMAMLETIRRATGGAVEPNDFLPEQEAGTPRPFRPEGHSDELQGDDGSARAGEAASVESHGANETAPPEITEAAE